MNPRLKLSNLKIKVGVLCGGNSAERKISKRSGKSVSRALQKSGFQVVLIDPAKKKSFRTQLKVIDVAFIALHGQGGEDGQIQSLLTRLKIPYVGSAAVPSRCAFNKEKSKKKLVQGKVATPPYRVLRTRTWSNQFPGFKPPYFVKPLEEGSSIGVFAVEDLSKSAVKIKKAIQRYRALLIEKQIIGREFTVSILDNCALPVIELKPKEQFYNYKAKYTKGMTRYLVPAPIAKKLELKLRKLALKTHRVLGLRDFSRIDFMVNEKGQPFVLEANSIPGLTELSLFPKAARAAGISFENLCRHLVIRAAARL